MRNAISVSREGRLDVEEKGRRDSGDCVCPVDGEGRLTLEEIWKQSGWAGNSQCKPCRGLWLPSVGTDHSLQFSTCF